MEKIVWAMLQRFLIPKMFSIKFRLRFVRNRLPPTWRACPGHTLQCHVSLHKLRIPSSLAPMTRRVRILGSREALDWPPTDAEGNPADRGVDPESDCGV